MGGGAVEMDRKNSKVLAQYNYCVFVCSRGILACSLWKEAKDLPGLGAINLKISGIVLSVRQQMMTAFQTVLT